MYILTKLFEVFMNQVNQHIGSRIRNFRKMKKLTIQQLADIIHKSRATVSKYETGEITLDIETLYDISAALDVDLNQLTDYRPPKAEVPAEIVDYSGRSPFYQAEKLYFYFYDGRYNRLKDGIINIHRNTYDNGCYDASLSIRSITPAGRVSEVYCFFF